MAQINIMFTRFSAFYSPLIASIAAGFLKAEGLEPTHAVAAPGISAVKGLADGSAHVVQSALSNSFAALEKGETPPAVHFAQINERDGFFLAAREADPGFTWDKLAGKQVLVDHGGQPLAMFKYALHRKGVAYDSIQAIDAGDVRAIDNAFRSGQGDYVHQQGPAPQQLERDGVGHVVASIGEAIGPVAFSSLAASPEWLRTDMAKAFVRAYAKARHYVNDTPAAEIARAEAAYFPDVDQDVLAATITAYQGLGCWTPTLPITADAFEVTLDVFQHCGLITKRHAYEDIVAPPPEA